MQSISSSYSQLRDAFQNNSSIVITKDHQWYTRSWISTLFRKIFGLHRSDTLEAGNKIAQYVYRLPIDSQDQKNQGLHISHPEEISTLLQEVSRAIKKLYSKEYISLEKAKKEKKLLEDKKSNRYSTLKKQVQKLKRKYRSCFETVAGIERTRHSVTSLSKKQQEIYNFQREKESKETIELTGADVGDISQEEEKAKKERELNIAFLTSQVEAFKKRKEEKIQHNDDMSWLKKHVDIFQRRQKTALLRPESEEDQLLKIARACQYSEFIETLRNNWILKEAFIKMLCRGSGHGSIDTIDCFIQAPYISDCLRKSFLDKRLQRIANDGLRFIQNASGKKEVQLLIHQKYQPISYLDGDLDIAHDHKIQVSELFKKFQSINNEIIDLEYLQTGIERLDFQAGIERLDFRLNIDIFQKPDWWKHLPLVETVTRASLQSRFPDDTIHENFPFLVIHSTSETPGLSISGTHGYLDIYIPQEDGSYNLISPGKYGDRFLPSLKEPGSNSMKDILRIPRKIIESIQTIFSTQRGIYCLVDQNNYMSHRTHHELAIPITTETNRNILMNHVKEMFISAKENRMIFQAQGDNCTAPIAQLIYQLNPTLSPNLFSAPFTKIDAPAPFSFIQKAQVLFPSDSSWNRFRIIISSLFGAKKPLTGTKNSATCLHEYTPWRNNMLHLPSMFSQYKNFQALSLITPGE